MAAKKQIDKVLFLTVLLLCWIGIIAVFGASTEISNAYYGNRFHFLTRQILWFVIGLFILFICIRIPLESIRLLSKPALLIIFILLILLFMVGFEVKGATRWINLGFMNLQPSTLAQLALIIYTADYLNRRHDDLEDIKRLYPILVILVVFAGLIALQPDFSTAAMLALVIFTILFISPIPFKNLLIILLSGVGLAIPVFVMKAYRMKRLIAWFTESDAHAMATNWQSFQSVTSFGLGGLFGVGFGYSRQKFFFLPEAHTDYILAIIGEEMGFIGVVLVLSLFLVLIWRGFKIATNSTTRFHYYLAAGLTIYLGLYAFINIMVVIGLLPSTGLPLPFISYGGSQLLVNMICVGILLNISSTSHESVYREDNLG
jgi:cell division protein FtsW